MKYVIFQLFLNYIVFHSGIVSFEETQVIHIIIGESKSFPLTTHLYTVIHLCRITSVLTTKSSTQQLYFLVSKLTRCVSILFDWSRAIKLKKSSSGTVGPRGMGGNSTRWSLIRDA